MAHLSPRVLMACGAMFGVLLSGSADALSTIRACFTPEQNCTADLVSLIASAHTSIAMQAYSFGSREIVRALAGAARHGVRVSIIFDKSAFVGPHAQAVRYLWKQGVQVWCDYLPSIAHNKVMIIDDQTVETGSFNYTYSAQKYNAENVLILENTQMAMEYSRNWQHRATLSLAFPASPHSIDAVWQQCVSHLGPYRRDGH